MFSWTPSYTQAGDYTLQFTARATATALGRSLSALTLPIQVINVNRAPVLGAIVDQTVQKGQTLDVPVAATRPTAIR